MAVAVVTVFVLVLRPGPAAVAAACTGVTVVAFRRRARAAVGVLSAPLLAGLFGIAVALGTLGRTWSGPLTLQSHLGPWGAAALGGLASLLVNNLPAASLLAARTPPHPFSLLVGLNVGPNLFVTGSLAWVLWLKSARAAGGRPSVRARRPAWPRQRAPRRRRGGGPARRDRVPLSGRYRPASSPSPPCRTDDQAASSAVRAAVALGWPA